MRNEKTINEFFLVGLRNQHAVEKEAKELLARQIDRLEHYPVLSERLRLHLTETEQQAKRLEHILQRRDDQPSGIKDVAMSAMGNLAALAHTMAQDEVLKDTFASMAFENFEIASYKSLIVLAELSGASTDISLLQQSLHEEEDMAQFIHDQIDPLTRHYIERLSQDEKANR